MDFDVSHSLVIKWPYCKSVKGESLEESWFPSVKVGYEGSIVKLLKAV